MQTNQTVSHNKIIVLVVFICASILTSLLVYRMSHKTINELKVANGNSVIFTAARDIKPVELYVNANEKLPKSVFMHHWTLLFFGFTHCSSFCPTTLAMLDQVYNKLRVAHPDLQVVFVSLDPERDNLDTLHKYTQSFNPTFISATGSLQELRKFQSQLGIFSMREQGTTKHKKDYQMQHSASILLIDPHGKWAGMFNANIGTDEFISLFENNVKLLSQQHNYV